MIGKLSFVCNVVPSCRRFLRHLIYLCKTIKWQHHHVSLNSAAWQDISWWQEFLPKWNGKSVIQAPDWFNASDLHIFTDALGSICFGIYIKGSWIAHATFRTIIQLNGKNYFPLLLLVTFGAKNGVH